MAATYDLSVFVNMPFDRIHQPLLRAVLFAIHDCGYIARSALEEEDSGRVRVQKIQELIRLSRYGIHDISRAGADRKTGLARFNMPFELGLFLGAKTFGTAQQREKHCLILDRERYRYQRFCSDIAGQDVAAHDGSVVGAIKCVRNWLGAQSAKNGVVVPGGATMVARYDAFLRAVPSMCRRLQVDPTELTHGDLGVLRDGWLIEHEWRPSRSL
jgi:hypothetical protein